MHLIRALRDCKQRSLTVSKKTPTVSNKKLSEDFSLLVAFLLVTFSWLFRGFFVAFSWLFRGPCFGQILRVLALEQSSETSPFISWFAGQM